MRRTSLVVLAAALTLCAPRAAAQEPASSPVTAVLRVEGGRTAFKSGERITLELALTSTQSGFIVDTAGLERAEDQLNVSPDVVRLPTDGRRDYLSTSALSTQPVVLALTANYWLRFDRAGDYEISVTTRRVSRAGKNGWADGNNPSLSVTSNTIKLHVDRATDEEERAMLQSAVAALHSAEGRRLEVEISAAEQLAFLTGDDAAVQKYQFYRTLPPRMANARVILRRGFQMTRNPAAILTAAERDLDDASVPATQQTLADVVALRADVEGLPRDGSWVLTDTTGQTDRRSEIQRAYEARVHDSLPARSAQSRWQTAAMLFTLRPASTWPDVRDIVVANLDQLPIEARRRLLTSFAQQLKGPGLSAAMLRAIDASAPTDRMSLLERLADVDATAAISPFLAAIADPAVYVPASDVQRLPAGSLYAASAPLMSLILQMAATRPANDFALEQKIALLPAVADASVIEDVRALRASWGRTFGRDARADLVGYLLKWDSQAALPLLTDAMLEADGAAFLTRATTYAYAPGLDWILESRISGSDMEIVVTAAYVYQRAQRPGAREFIGQRLLRWRIERRELLAAGTTLTGRDGLYESELVSFALGRRDKLAPAERDTLIAACITDRCRAQLRFR